MIKAEEIKRAVSCRRFAERIGLKVNHSGFCCCPFHLEDTPSLKIYDASDSWYCFGCNQGGDVIRMASLYYKAGFTETIRMLAAEFGIAGSDDHRTRSEALRSSIRAAIDKSSREKKERLRRALRQKYDSLTKEMYSLREYIAAHAPVNRDADFEQAFADAIHRKCLLEYELDCTAEELNHA